MRPMALGQKPSSDVTRTTLTREDPFPEQISTASFRWGKHDRSHLEPIIESTYTEAIHWRHNILYDSLRQGGQGTCQRTS